MPPAVPSSAPSTCEATRGAVSSVCVADTVAGRTVATPIEASDHHDGSPGACEGGDETEAWQMKGGDETEAWQMKGGDETEAWQMKGGDEIEAWQMKGTSGAHSAWLTNP